MYMSRRKIQEAMCAEGIKTFTALADEIGITKNQLSVMLSDNYNPFKSRVMDLCRALKVEPNELMAPGTPAEPTIAEEIEPGDVTAIELFAGAGGLALGLEQAGIKTLEYVELDKACCETLKLNRPQWNVLCEDIHNVDFTSFRGRVDIVTGGFPCQAFSYAGKKLGFEDTRGTLFHEFARCVKEVQPAMFWAENVRGLASHDQGRTLETILSVFEGLGYTVGDRKKILNACYYGVGQKRERIVIIGIDDLANGAQGLPSVDRRGVQREEKGGVCSRSARRMLGGSAGRHRQGLYGKILLQRRRAQGNGEAYFLGRAMPHADMQPLSEADGSLPPGRGAALYRAGIRSHPGISG